MKIGQVGMGYVGQAQRNLIDNPEDEFFLYDPALGETDKDAINDCDIVFIAVPTPKLKSGECDIRIVEKTAEWVKAPLIIIQSTVSVGTTRRLNMRFGARFVFQPEYFGETTAHPMMDKNNRSFVILGGPEPLTQQAANFYQRVYNANIQIAQTDSTTAELCKYMENAFFATKVTFCNEMYEIAKEIGVDYHELRELWLLDPRVTRSHTFVYPDNRGFGGKCLPKDLAALIFRAHQADYQPKLLEEVSRTNRRIRRRHR